MGTFTKGAAPRAVKFSSIGAKVAGVVYSIDREAQMNFTADNRPDGLRFDGNGNVVLTTTITLATTDDNGDPTTNLVKLRVGDSIFTDQGREAAATTSGLAIAIAEGVEAAGAADLNVGDTITVEYVSDAPVDTEGYTPAKVYAVTVTPAA